MAKPIDTQLTTDDSQVGRGAILNDKEAQGFWDSVIGITLSSHREMWTVLIISISSIQGPRIQKNNSSGVGQYFNCSLLEPYEQNKS